MAKLKSTDLNGNLFVSGQLKLVNPFLITTDSLITNLNADLLDGYHANDIIVKSSKCYDTSSSDTKDGTWTVSIPGITELTEGLTIKIRLKRAGASTCTLNLNGLGAKTVYFRYGSKLTTHYSKESVLALTYTTDATDAISSGTDRTGWIVENIYDSTNTYQLRKYYSRYTTKSVLYRLMICFVNKDNLLIPANNVSNSIATNKTLTTDSFDLSKGIYYYGSTTTVAAGGIIGNGILYQQFAILDLRYSFNTGTTLTPYKPVYVVVTPTGSSGEVVLASNPISQTIPTADDGNRYVFLGYSTDNYRIELTIDHPVYVYNSIAKAYVAENYSQEADIKNLQSNFVINSQANGGFVSAGGTNYNKVWKTDWSGNPAWRDVITYRDLGVDTQFQNLNLATERDVIYYTTASAVVAKLTPFPFSTGAGEAFVQTVWCGSVKYLVQDLTWRSGTNFRRFSRTCNNGTFGDWKEYTYTSHLNNYQPKDGDLTAIAGLSGTGFLKRTGDNTWSLDTIDPTQYYWANVNISKTSSDTTFPRFKSLRAGNTVYNIATLKTTSTPVETVLHTGIKWTSSSYMPIIHLTGYAYGLTSPVEFKIGFYIYNNQLGWCGVTNMGAWKPDVLLFKDTRNGVDYVAVGLKGSCYFLMLEANLQENMNNIPSSINLDPSLWYFSTQTADQVTTNGSTIPEGGNAPQSICVKVPYRTIRTNVDSADYASNSDKLDGQDGSYYLNYNNFTHTPTILTQEDIQTAIDNIPYAGCEDILEGITGRTKVQWNALNAGEYGSNSTYNGTNLPPVLVESNSGFWNSSSGTPLDISFHFAKKEKMATLEVLCPPYGGVNPTMSVYYAQAGDSGLTLYKEIATISTNTKQIYEFNEEGISADYWVVRFTASGWIDLRLCKPGGPFTPGLYNAVCYQQIMDKLNGYQPVGNYALKNEIIAKSVLTTKGDLIYASDANTPARLGIGSNGQFLSITNGIPTWANNPNTDTDKKTASSNNDSKLYLIGATTQSTDGQNTYSNSKVYTQSGKLYSNNTEVALEGKFISRVTSLPTASESSKDFIEVNSILYKKVKTGSSSYEYAPANTQVVRLI